MSFGRAADGLCNALIEESNSNRRVELLLITHCFAHLSQSLFSAGFSKRTNALLNI
jgi:hypothetical protein